ncbi:MAG: lipopolysaccharide biosynthesis protein [Sinobacteraceae bacterium]|nr:lipopolysaccharide biosynthesis protein [Nevskiaceae bacterium]
MIRFADKRILLECLRPDLAGLGSKVAIGAAWTFTNVGLRIVLTIASTAILARLLTPEDFGLIAMSALVTEFAALLGNIGIGGILIQRKALRRLDMDTAFWITMAIDTALCLLVLVASFIAAAIFETPQVQTIIAVSSLSFILAGLSTIHLALLSRTMRFREDFMVQAGSLVVRLTASVVLAVSGFGVWSLVFAALIGQATTLLLACAVVPFVPRLRFNRRLLSEYARTSGSYLGGGLVNYLMSNIDYMIVGRRFGPEALGYYQTAFSLPEELRNRLSAPLQRVLFPAYSRLQDDLSAMQYGVLKSLRLLSAITIPLGVGLAAVSDGLVQVLYGNQWLPVIPLLEILAIGGAARSIFSLTANIFYATDNPHLAFKISLAMLPVTIVALVTGSQWGLTGVAWAMLAVQFLSAISAHLALRLIELSLLDFLKQLFPATTASALMFAALRALPDELLSAPPLVSLLLEVMIGATLYALALAFIAPPLFREFREIARRIVGRRSPPESPGAPSDK